MKNKDFEYVGTFNKWGKPDGIGRMVLANNCVQEGAFEAGWATGWSRCIEPCGNYFAGIYN